MAKRFSRLKFALSTLRTPNSTTPAPDAPTGSVAREFQDFVSGKKVISYPRLETSKPGSLVKVSILPFYFAGVDGSETIVPQSLRGINAEPLNPARAACNQLEADTANHQEIRSFIPAKVTIFDYGTGTSSETSKITGIDYLKRTGASFTFPYGASATEKAEGQVRQGIQTAVNALGTASVSFTSERI